MASNSNLLSIYLDLKRRIDEIDVRQGGPQGPRGKKGDQGVQGKKGDQGPKGEKGDRGPVGPQGAGKPGRDGKDGKDGKDGQRGPSGPAGVDGRDGVDGTDGADGVGISGASVDFDGHLYLDLTNGESIDVGLVREDAEGQTIVYTGGSGGSGSDSGGSGPTPPHNDLDGLQGNGPEYYHLNEAEWTTVIDWITNGVPPSALPDHNQLTGLQGTGPEYIHLNQAEFDRLDTGTVEGVTGTTPIQVNNTDPQNPVVSITTFAGAATSGAVPNPVTESGRFLSDDGTWQPVAGLETVVYTSDATSDPLTDVALAWNDYADRTAITIAGNEIVFFRWPGTSDDVYQYIGNESAPPWTTTTNDWVNIGGGSVSWGTIIGDINAQTDLANALRQKGAVGLDYTFTNDTAATDPGNGGIKLNNADQSLATEMYVSKQSGLGNDLSRYWNGLQQQDNFNLIEVGNEYHFVGFEIAGPIVDNGTWYTVPVANLETVGAINNGAPAQVYWTQDTRTTVRRGGTDGQVYTKGVGAFEYSWEAVPPTDWADIPNKPTEFPPAAHTLGSHSDVVLTAAVADEVLTFDGANWVNLAVPPTDWADIPNKPATFPPSAHTHVKADVTDLLEFDGTESNLVPLPATIQGFVLSDNGTWIAPDTGPQGPQGEKGDGWTGGSYDPLTGIVTFTSDDGLGFVTEDLRGADGADGADGATGPQGPQGDTGPAGPAGADGADGADGLDGNTVLNGVVPPVAGDGVDGDFFIDTATDTIYGPKAAGVWPTPGTPLVGPQGPAGADGADGADGAQGPQGDPGPTGPEGPQGPEGPTAVSADAGNYSTLGTDSLIYTPATDWADIPNKPATFPPAAHTLDSHSDVSAPTPDDGERLAWDAIQGLWVPRRSTSALGIVALSYRWTTPVSTTPGTGRVSTNNADPTLVTEVYINEIDDGGNDNSIYFDNIGEGDWFNVIDRQDDTNTNQYDVTAPPVLAAGVYTIPVVYFANAGPNFSNNEQVAVFIRYTASGVTDHTDLTNIGVNTHAQIDTHIADTNIHYADAPDASSYLRQNGAWVPYNPPPSLPAGTTDLSTLHWDNTGAAWVENVNFRTDDASVSIYDSAATTFDDGIGQIFFYGFDPVTNGPIAEIGYDDRSFADFRITASRTGAVIQLEPEGANVMSVFQNGVGINNGAITPPVGDIYLQVGNGTGSGGKISADALELIDLVGTGERLVGVDATGLLVESTQTSFPPAAHTHDTADVVSGTFANARIAQSNVTQHQAALSIAGSQLTGTVDGGTY